MDYSEDIKVCRATAFATTFAIRVERAFGSGIPSLEEMNLDLFVEEARVVANEAAKRYARVLSPTLARTEDRGRLPDPA